MSVLTVFVLRLLPGYRGGKPGDSRAHEQPHTVEHIWGSSGPFLTIPFVGVSVFPANKFFARDAINMCQASIRSVSGRLAHDLPLRPCLRYGYSLILSFVSPGMERAGKISVKGPEKHQLVPGRDQMVFPADPCLAENEVPDATDSR
jgi:hypothetical protein